MSEANSDADSGVSAAETPAENAAEIPLPVVAPSALLAATGAHDDPEPPAAAADSPDEAADGPRATPEEAQESEEARESDEQPPDDPVEVPVPEEDDEATAAWREVALATRIEALLFAGTEPLSVRRLQRLAGDVQADDVRSALTALGEEYDANGRAFGLQEIGGGFQLRTRPELAELIVRLGRRGPASERLSKAALETLAIVAYRQPVLRADVEKIRGVATGDVLRTLAEKGLVRVAGRADLPGSPLLYGTTPAFLELFGLRNLADLPSVRELRP